MTTTVALLSGFWNHETERRLALMQEGSPEGITAIGVDSSKSEGEVIEALADVNVIVPWQALVPLSIARECRNLKLVQLLAAGYGQYDVGGLNALGIQLANNGGSNAHSVAEHTVMLMLAVYRRFGEAWQSVSAGRWRDDVADLPLRSEIAGKTVGLIGFGNIGRLVARRLSGFDVELLYCDVLELPPGRGLELGAKAVSQDELLAKSDIVSLHIHGLKSTRGMIGEREFGLMKPSAILVNTARGAVVDEAALIRALEAGQIAGAGLDVLEAEPTSPDNPLLTMERVVVTPHWAGGTLEGSALCAQFALENVARFAAGRPVLSLVEPDE